MARDRRRVLLWLLAVLAVAGAPVSGPLLGVAASADGVGRVSTEDLIVLSTRTGVTQSFLHAAPNEPRALAVLFPGGDGNVDLASLRDRFELERGNFLIRARKHLLGAGVVTALVTSPSDQADGMLDDFRFSEAHAADMRAVVSELKRRHPGLPVVLVGTSRGAVSAAAVGVALGADISGVVLTATVTRASGGIRGSPGLSGFDYSRLKTRTLLVHHRDDGCNVSPYAGARALADRFPLISVSGGAPAQSAPCQALSPHGFIGQEGKTMTAIADWILGRPYPALIE